MQPIKKRKPYWLVLVVIILLLPAVFTLMGAFLIAPDPLTTAEVIVVLSGDSGDRVEEAIRLYQEGYGRLILLTETGLTTFDPNVMVTQLKLNRLMDAGIPEDAIRVSPITAATTVEEASAVAGQMAYYGWNSCIVVTGPYHTRRAGIIFHQIMEGDGITVSLRPASDSWYRPWSWWLSSLGWQVTLHEYGGLLGLLFGFSSY